MKIKANILATLSLTALAMPFNGICRNSIVQDIAPYVYPANIPAGVPTMKFMPDGLSYLAANSDNTRIIKYDLATGKEIETVFNAAKTREASISGFESFSISPDGTKLLICLDKEMIYRRSFKAKYYVFEIKRNILKPLSKEHSCQQIPTFSPDGRSVAFVADNNIYLKKLDYDTEVQVTTNGVKNSVINGATDWTYEEEFVSTSTLAWAPDSETLSYVSFDETDVPLYNIALYQGSCNPLNEYALYPGQLSYKYPVAGANNSIVSLHSYDVSTRKTKDITLPDAQIEYIPRIDYTSSSEQLLVTTLNRDQNRIEIYSVNPKSTVVKSLYVEESKAWISPVTYENLVVTSKSVIINSPRSGYNHLYEYSLAGAQLRQITSGDYDVKQCYGVDKAGNVYYQSTASGPLNRVVSKVDVKGKISELSPSGSFSSAEFTPGCEALVLTVSDAVTPPNYTLLNSSGKKIRELGNNADIKSRYAGLPEKRFITINSDGNLLNGYMILPPAFNESREYPVIMWQYSGPGSQEVLNKWALDWEYFAAKEGFIVACVDGRGTGSRGREFETCVYRNLGYYETIDQINAARYMASLPYVDADRIGISGWSYGGYETLMSISVPGNPYKAAVAIAPVTDWRYYDTVYAERYMLTPRANEDGYNSSAPLLKTANVDCELLIMSGTADDNVHMANTMEYVSRLQADGILCDMLLFPNMNHSINGCGARAVVYGKMIDFFKRNL
ncbi:MAG: S9 family peptidase [Muribaculaceae bacterium]|nr:S9 family peptidase [Muribaculaceae bacterium]